MKGPHNVRGSSRGGGAWPGLSHNVTRPPQDKEAMKGARTKTDVEPMSTSEFKGHIARGRRELAK